jgi:hypothetical protein
MSAVQKHHRLGGSISTVPFPLMPHVEHADAEHKAVSTWPSRLFFDPFFGAGLPIRPMHAEKRATGSWPNFPLSDVLDP